MNQIKLTILTLFVASFGLLCQAVGLAGQGEMMYASGNGFCALSLICLAIGLTRDP